MNRVLATITLLALVATPAGSAQTTRQAAPCDAGPVSALTTELRELREELGQSTLARMRMQLAMARMQVQEERVLHLDTQRGAIAMRRAQRENERAALASQLAQFSTVLDAANTVSPEDRRQIQQMLTEQKARLAQLDASIQQLRIDESDAQSALTEGQGQLNQITAGLAELERSLTK
jgi:chromosome segregation ATPase